MRIIQEVYVGRKGGPRDTWSYCFFVKLDACKVTWEGHAHSSEEAARKAKSSLRCSNLQGLVGASTGIDSVVVRFRLEKYEENGNLRRNADLPLGSKDWPVVMWEMALVAYGQPGAKERFIDFEINGLRPPRRQR